MGESSDEEGDDFLLIEKIVSKGFYYFYCTFLVLLPTIHSLLCTYIHTLQFVVLGMVEFAEHSIDVRGSISASAMIRRDDVVGRDIVINL